MWPFSRKQKPASQTSVVPSGADLEKEQTAAVVEVANKEISSMSFFKKMFSWIEKAFTSTTWEDKVSNGISLVAPLTNTLITLTAGEAAATEVAAVVKEVQTDLTVVKGLVTSTHPDVKATATESIPKYLNAISESLSALLSAGHVKNPDTLAKVTGITNTIIGEVEAIVGMLPAKA